MVPFVHDRPATLVNSQQLWSPAKEQACPSCSMDGSGACESPTLAEELWTAGAFWAGESFIKVWLLVSNGCLFLKFLSCLK